MVTCPHCGDTSARSGGFCPACGKPVPQEATPVTEDIPLAEPLDFDSLREPDSTGTMAVAPAAAAPLPAKPVARPARKGPGMAPAPARREKPARRGRPRKARRGRARQRPPREDIAGFETTEIPRVAKQPPPESVALPHATLELSAQYEYTSVPVEDPPVVGILLEIEAFGKPFARTANAPVAHVILVLDLSASMDTPEKYPVLRSAVEGMLEDLRAEDSGNVLVSVIVFSRGAEVVLKGMPARKILPDALFKAIEEHHLCFGTYTEIPGALSKAGRIAYDQVRACRTLPTRIYLLTDGKPQDVVGAVEMADRLGQVPCDVHALAFGSDADVAILQQLFAGMRGGTVKSVRTDTIEHAFERVAEVAQQVVATRCRLAVDLAPGVVGGEAFRYRPGRVRFPEPAFEEGKRFFTDLGTIETGRKYSLLFEVRPPENEEAVTHLGDVIVQIPGVGGPITATAELTLSRTEAGSLPGEVDSLVRTARDILDALTDGVPQSALRALRLRRKIYDEERRDPGLLAIIDRAIDLLETTGSLEGLSPEEYSTLLSHTCTSGNESASAFPR